MPGEVSRENGGGAGVAKRPSQEPLTQLFSTPERSEYSGLRNTEDWMPDARLLTRAMLRAFLGNMAWPEVCVRMKRGQIPKPLWGVPADDKTARWDSRAVNRALDRASEI